MNTTTETGCCPRFDPQPWQEKEVAWTDKLFVKDTVKSFFYIPTNMGKVVSKNMKKLEESGAKNPEYLMLSDEVSPWKSHLLIAVDKEVTGTQSEKISGKFITRAFEGPYSKVGQWIREMKKDMTSKGQKATKFYFWYTTCPKCAKAYGKNYTVIFAQV